MKFGNMLWTESKKLSVYACLLIFVFAGVSLTRKTEDEHTGKNLRVIPKNIDGAQIERLMHKMSHDLGVMCSNCHPYTKPEVSPMRVDFESDELPDKNIARKMMTMTDKLNKKYFGFKNSYSMDDMNRKDIITCNTCHRGLLKPDNTFIIPAPN